MDIMEELYGMTNTEKVKEYVYNNYKSYKGKQLIIKEFESHFKIYKHEDGGPLILGKSII